MVEQEIAKLGGYEIIDGKLTLALAWIWFLWFNLFPQSPFITCTFSFPVFYFILMAGDQFETQNTKRKPQEKFKVLMV